MNPTRHEPTDAHSTGSRLTREDNILLADLSRMFNLVDPPPADLTARIIFIYDLNYSDLSWTQRRHGVTDSNSEDLEEYQKISNSKGQLEEYKISLKEHDS